MRPERAGPLLPALADEPDLVGRGQLEVGDPEIEEFLDPRPGIDQRGQHGVVPAARARGAIDRAQHGGELRGLQIGKGPHAGPLERDAEDLLRVRQGRRVLRRQEAEEGVDRRQAHVASRGRVLPGLFQVGEERHHGVDIQIVHVQAGDRAVAAPDEDDR